MPKKLVYVADDEPAALEILRRGLEHEGYEVVTAADGATLLAEVERRVPDLVLLDIHMPDLSGWEVRARLERHAATSKVPVIAVTAFGGPGIDAVNMGALGFEDYLRKPFPLADLWAKVASALGHAKT